MAHIDATPIEQILDVPQGPWTADGEHHIKPDELGRGLEVVKRGMFSEPDAGTEHLANLIVHRAYFVL